MIKYSKNIRLREGLCEGLRRGGLPSLDATAKLALIFTPNIREVFKKRVTFVIFSFPT